jgi:hypothetical protein
MNDNITFILFCSMLSAFLLAIIGGVTVYNLKELELKREALARGTSALEIQCMFPNSDIQAACAVLLGAKQ